ncbi:hypothetical protein BBK82_00595 [Lentzea guizhouensis]|uniref:Uncharacterized protein n=1 Tax=Lentzea guizhouensis TaxID=1586287 RepID=A0A1B2HAQ0_9PSEU|nr:hypothetical protein [Lentzea guizhouensis]ANZ34795.1 hypothetical protein BBK82_00595 [Lentzea guizhouensis]
MDPRRFVKRLPVADALLDRKAYVGARGDRRAALLNALLPSGSLTHSLTFVVAPANAAVLSWPARLPPLTALLAPGSPLTGAQVVVHTRPPAPDAYRELIQHGSPAHRWTYVAVSSADPASAAAWTRTVLEQHGFTAAQLDHDEVLDVVAFLGSLDGAAAQALLIERGFEACTMGADQHACFTWSEAPMLELLSRFPAVAATVGVRLARTGGEFVSERVLRLSGQDTKALLAAETWLASGIRHAGRVRRLNGHHAAAAAVTVPVCVPPSLPSKQSWTHVEPVHVAGQAAAWTGGAVSCWAGTSCGRPTRRCGSSTNARSSAWSRAPGWRTCSRPAVSCGAAVTVQSPAPWRGPFGHAQPGLPAGAGQSAAAAPARAGPAGGRPRARRPAGLAPRGARGRRPRP